MEVKEFTVFLTLDLQKHNLFYIFHRQHIYINYACYETNSKTDFSPVLLQKWYTIINNPCE